MGGERTNRTPGSHPYFIAANGDSAGCSTPEDVSRVILDRIGSIPTGNLRSDRVPLRFPPV